MDHITKLYKNRAEMLAEQVAFLEKQLKNIQEAQAPAMVFSGSGKGQKYFSDEELRDQVRQFKRIGLFGAEVPLENQQQEYKDAVAELERRAKSQEEPKAKSTTTAKPSETKPMGVSAPGVGVGKTEPTAPTTKAQTRIPVQKPKVPTGGVQTGQPIQKPEQKIYTGTPASSTGAEGTGQIISQEESGMSPNLLVPGIVAAGLYGVKKGIEQAQRVREPFKPAVTKPVEVNPPQSTVEGKPVIKSKPSVADKAALQRDVFRTKTSGEIKTGTSFEIPRPGVDFFYNTKYSPESWTNIVNRMRGVNVSSVPDTLTQSQKLGNMTQTPPMALPRRRGESMDDVDARTLQQLEAERPGSTRPQSISSKITKGAAKVAKGVAHFGVQAAGAVAAEKGAEDIARASGVGKTEAQTLATLGVGIPMSVIPALSGTPMAIAALAGYGLGKGIEYGMEASGKADEQRLEMAREAMNQNPQLARGLNDYADPVAQATKAGQAISSDAKTARRVDIEKGFASPKEAAEFAKNMLDPKFREKYEKEMRLGYQEKMKKIEDASVEIPGIATYVRDPGSENLIDKAGRWISKTLPSWATGVDEPSEWYDPSMRPSTRGMPYEKK